MFPLKESFNILILSVPRQSQGLRQVPGEEACDSEEDSEYMIPSSRPIAVPSVPDTLQVQRPPQPLTALQAQTQAPAVNSRYSNLPKGTLGKIFES